MKQWVGCGPIGLIVKIDRKGNVPIIESDPPPPL